jgi:ferredoxin
LNSQYTNEQHFLTTERSGRMSRLRVDRDLCEGYANCVFQAPDVFDLGDDNIVVPQAGDIGKADHERVAEAVASCPVSALSLDND